MAKPGFKPKLAGTRTHTFHIVHSLEVAAVVGGEQEGRGEVGSLQSATLHLLCSPWEASLEACESSLGAGPLSRVLGPKLAGEGRRSATGKAVGIAHQVHNYEKWGLVCFLVFSP